MMRITACVVRFALFCVGLAIVPTSAAGPLHFAGDRALDISHIKLELKVDLEEKTVSGRATVDAVALRRVETIRFDAVDFDVSAARLSLGGDVAVPCEIDNDGKHLILALPHPLPAGGKVTALIDYQLADPKSGLHFHAPSDTEPDVPYVMWSQGQSITNRYWVPCFDHPNEMQTTEIICTVDRPYIAISNGQLIETVENDDGTRTFHWRQGKPHVSYLMTLVVGEFVCKTDTWRGRPVTYYVRPKFEDRIDNSFGNTPAMLEFFSDKIGVEYPWPKYAQICCYSFGGGMENTSATTLGEGTLHDDRAHLDTSSDGLVAHELAHQWFGDLLTCREWAHLWLNEGFASYFEALWDEHHNGPEAFAYNMSRKARSAIGGGKDKPIVYRRYDSPGEQFDSRAYPKGAWVLHMIRRRLGDEAFWKVINTYCRRYRHKTVETVDLRKTVEEVTGRSFERFFYDWTERAGHPVVEVACEWRPDEKAAAVTIEQTQEAEAFHFPIEFEFHFDGDAEPVVVTREITDKHTEFAFPLPAEPRLFRVDPEQAVLMESTESKPHDLWAAQLTDDANPVARLAALDHLAKTASAEDLKELLVRRLAREPFWAVQQKIAESLGDAGGEVPRDALLAGLTLEHPKARAAVVEALGEFDGEPAVAQKLLALVEKGDPSYRVEAAAIRAYARVHGDEDERRLLELLEPLLARDSDDEIIRTTILRSIGSYCGADGLDVLIGWSRPAKPRECRSEAVAAIGRVLTGDRTKIAEDARDRAMDAIRAGLESESTRLQSAALRALGNLGNEAGDLLPRIDELAETGRRWIKGMARRTAEKIRDDRPLKEQIEKLRRQLAELQEENKALDERLEKVEAVRRP